jgi:hypothetical protein
MTQLVIAWIALGAVTLGLALYRKALAMREDPYVHIGTGEERLIPQQVATSQATSVGNTASEVLQ